jgi:hypothetical protein
MYCNYEYIEAMKKQKEKHQHLLKNGNPLYCNEYGGGNSKITVRIIESDGKKYYVAENWLGSVIDLREI